MPTSRDRTGLSPDKTPDWQPDQLRLKPGESILTATTSSGVVRKILAGRSSAEIARVGDIEYSENIRPALRKIAGAKARQSSIAMIGHSIVAGYQTNGSSTMLPADELDWASLSLSTRIAQSLNFSLGTASEAGAVFATPTQQGRWTLGGGATFTNNNGNGLGGYRVILGAAAHYAEIVLTGTTVYCYMIAGDVGVAPRYSVDGGAITAGPAAVSDPTGFGTGQYYRLTITGLSAGPHTVRIYGPSSNAASITAIEARTQTAEGVVVHRAGIPSATINDVLTCALDNTDTYGPSAYVGSSYAAKRIAQSDSITYALTPDLCIVMTDVNNLISGYQSNYTLSDIKRHVKNVIEQLASRGLPTLIVVGPWRRLDTVTTAYLQEDVVAQYRAAVAESTTAAICDIRSWAYADQGFADGLMLFDHVHPYKTGAAALGKTIADSMLRSAMT